MAERLTVETLDGGTLIVDEHPVEVLEVSLPGPRGVPGPGVPVGGTEGEILRKRSSSDYDAEWAPPTTGSGFAFNVMDFDAKLDTKDRDDGSMTAGSNVLALDPETDDPFTTADIGKLVYVGGAGAGGDDLNKAILEGIDDATHARLTKVAQTTVTDARFQYGTDDTAALQVAADTARSTGRQTIYHPAGIGIYTGAAHGRGTGSLGDVDVGGAPFGYVGDDSDISIILPGDDWGDPLFQYLGRHGPSQTYFAEGGVHRDYRTMNPGKRFKGDWMNAWQLIGLAARNVYLEEVNGRIVTLVACHACDLDIRWKDCGRVDTSDPSVVFTWNLEGGILQNDQMLTADCRLRAIGDGNADAAVLWIGTQHCVADVDLDGSGLYRSSFYLVNGYACRIYGDIRGGGDDCVHIQSAGDQFGQSAYNLVDVIASGARGNTPGTGWGIHEQKGPGMVHTGNRLTGIFHDNALGGVSP